MRYLIILFMLVHCCFTVSADYRVEGRVYNESGKPLNGVAVSDGCKVVRTDSKGRYHLTSNLDLEVVFVSSPDGYEPVGRFGNRVKFWHNVPIRDVRNKMIKNLDFPMKRLSPDSSFSLLAVADLQISDRACDRNRLMNFYVPELNRAIDSLRKLGKSPVLLTLGDQTCEYYWHETGYKLDNFNNDFKVNCPVYFAMGNHDNDPCKPGDLLASSTWRSINGPNYYSFNRGGVHFAVLDNMLYKNADGAPGKPGRKDYTTALTDDQLEWLENDLANVKDKTAPLFLAMHGILLSYPEAEGKSPKKVYRMSVGSEKLDSLLSEFKDVRVLSGHAHKMHFMHTPDDRIKEYNYAAACGTWWPYKLRPNRENFWMCNDGSPWGFGIWDISGTELNHVYKGFGFPRNYQMRIYDLNKLTVDNPELSDKYLPGDEHNKNRILVNIWSYEPGCIVKIFEGDKELDVTRIKAQDPKHFQLRAIPLMKAGIEINQSLMPEFTTHIFTAKASPADKPIFVRFEDLYGNVFCDTLVRK